MYFLEWPYCLPRTWNAVPCSEDNKMLFYITNKSFIELLVTKWSRTLDGYVNYEEVKISATILSILFSACNLFCLCYFSVMAFG